MWSIGHNHKEVLDRLYRIDQHLASLSRKVDILMADRAAFDASLTSLTTEVSNLLTAVGQLIAKVQSSGVPVDFSAEKTQLDTISTNVQNELTNINTALNTPAVPQPAPIDAPASGSTSSAAPITSTSSASSTSADGSIAGTGEAVPTEPTEENTQPGV